MIKKCEIFQILEFIPLLPIIKFIRTSAFPELLVVDGEYDHAPTLYLDSSWNDIIGIWGKL